MSRGAEKKYCGKILKPPGANFQIAFRRRPLSCPAFSFGDRHRKNDV
jgi:hypothetical protein